MYAPRRPSLRWKSAARWKCFTYWRQPLVVEILSNLSVMDYASPEVLASMEDASIYMMRSANMITVRGGKLKQR